MRVALLAATVLLAAAGPQPPKGAPLPPQAQPPGVGARSYSPTALLFAGFDSNGDAQLDKAELAAGVARMWKVAAGGEASVGLIGLGEWAQVWLGDQSAPPGRFDFDRDQDDRITAAEFKAEFDRRFATFDADKDGVVIRAEMLQAAPQLMRMDRRLAQPRGPGQ